MADFLDHLITRTLGDSAAIRPRPPALFESPHAPEEYPSEEEWTPPPAVPAPQRDDRPAHVPTSPRLLSPSPLSPSPLSASTPLVLPPAEFSLPARPSNAQPSTAVPPTALPPAGLPQVAPSTAAAARVPSAPVPWGAPTSVEPIAGLPAAGGSSPAGATGSPPDQLVPVPATRPSREADPPATRRTRGASAPLPPGSAAEPFGTRVTSGAKAAAARVADIAPLNAGEWAWPPAPGSSLSPGTDKSVEQQAAAPVIQVTIGRVEVRASSSAAPERKPVRQPTVMSLDEYLKRAR